MTETTKTPIKVYARASADSLCRLCGVEFGANGLKPAFRIFGQLKSSANSDFLVKIRKVLEEDIIQVVSRSSVSCKPCHSKVCRFAKAIHEISEFREQFFENENRPNSGDVDPVKLQRLKRCSNSPHTSGPRRKITSSHALAGILTEGKEEDSLQLPSIESSKFCMPADAQPRCVHPENLPFHNIDDLELGREAPAITGNDSEKETSLYVRILKFCQNIQK